MNRNRLFFAAVAVCICASASAQTPLQEIDIGGSNNTSNWLDSARTGALLGQQLRNNRLNDQNNLLNQQVGDALARGNYEEAANIAARGGNLDLYWRIKEMEKR